MTMTYEEIVTKLAEIREQMDSAAHITDYFAIYKERVLHGMADAPEAMLRLIDCTFMAGAGAVVDLFLKHGEDTKEEFGEFYQQLVDEVSQSGMEKLTRLMMGDGPHSIQ